MGRRQTHKVGHTLLPSDIITAWCCRHITFLDDSVWYEAMDELSVPQSSLAP